MTFPEFCKANGVPWRKAEAEYLRRINKGEKRGIGLQCQVMSDIKSRALTELRWAAGKRRV